MNYEDKAKKPIAKRQKSRNEAMKKRSVGVRECKICGTRKGMIRKYKLGICRRCFKERAKDLGWEKYWGEKMAQQDPIVDALTKIRNAEAASQTQVSLKPASNFLGEVLKIAQQNGYIEGFDKKEEKGIISISVKLSGKLNECKAIKPRYAVKKTEFEKYEKRYLPARDVGLIIVSTPNGLMTHTEAKSKGLGGRLIAFMY